MVLSVIIKTINVAIVVALYLNTTPILGLHILSVLFVRFAMISSECGFIRMIIRRGSHLFAHCSAMKIDLIRSSGIPTLSYILLIMPVILSILKSSMAAITSITITICFVPIQIKLRFLYFGLFHIFVPCGFSSVAVEMSSDVSIPYLKYFYFSIFSLPSFDLIQRLPFYRLFLLFCF